MPGPAVVTAGVIMRLARDVRTALDQRFAAYDLTSQQAAVLIHVYAGEVSPRRIGELLGTDTAGMSRLLDRLESKGLIRRAADPGDRRAIVVSLTDRGASLIPQLPPLFEVVGSELASGLTEDEVEATLRVLQSMLHNLHGEGA
ncbi:MarR family winged helix-turn-helix transcriptional regulator [Parafrigoribacterium humi]|jgi:DNA-binding MarR family transcriptional regulator|uniref:MarR family winged helix-turn-helix transcriptional regulator n=1 Tax=Parafrigoribacterium humi TaxID=3144664 RepID=UPI0032EBE0E3